MHYLRQGKQLLLAIFLKTGQKRHHNTSITKYFSKNVFLTYYRLSTVYVESKEMTSTYFMHSKLCAHNKKNILSNWMFKSLISIVCFVYPCILMIKVVCHTKIISVSHLKHVITIKNMMLALIDLIWFFLVLFFRKRKKMVFFAN